MTKLKEIQIYTLKTENIERYATFMDYKTISLR